MTFRRTVAASELWPGEVRGVVVDGTKVLLVNVGGRVCAYANRCAHQGVELTKGKLDGCVLTCPAHEWQYDLETGEGVNPRGTRLPSYPVKLEGDDVLVDVASRREELAWVGPVLRRVAPASAIVEAILEDNVLAKVVDRGAYVRVHAPGVCRLSRESVERRAQAPFRLPSDLEQVMVSFKGRLRISDDEVVWEKP